MELPNIAAYAYQDVHVWSALLTCLRPAPPDPDLLDSFNFEVMGCMEAVWGWA